MVWQKAELVTLISTKFLVGCISSATQYCGFCFSDHEQITGVQIIIAPPLLKRLKHNFETTIFKYTIVHLQWHQ